MKRLSLLIWILFLEGCHLTTLPALGEYRSLSEMSHYGFLKKNDMQQKFKDRHVRLWGYLDLSNTAFENQQPPYAPFFHLKAYIDDPTGASVKVYCLGDKNAYRKIFKEVEKIKEEEKRAVLVRGVMRLHPCPTNFTMQYCIKIEVNSPKDIAFAPAF